MSNDFQRCYILSTRNISPPSSLKGFALRDYVDKISASELSKLQAFLNGLENVDIGPWIQDDDSVTSTRTILRSLSLKTGHQCLLPVGVINAYSSSSQIEDLGQRIVIAYYSERGYDTVPIRSKLTDEQITIAESGRTPQSAPPIRHVINAGPGTGKTTTIVELVRRGVESGIRILLLAYTNSAVTTMKKRIAADPYLGDKYRAEITSNTASPPVMLGTVDQFARIILGTNQRIMSSDYDQIISNARAKVEREPRCIDVVFAPDAVPLFTHIVVDEAQMLSSDRFELIHVVAKTMSIKSINGPRSCHLTIFCDPKQTISRNCGEQLEKIFENARSQLANASAGTRLQWTVSELTKTFRFRTQRMLNYVMELSKKRPALHVDMVIHESDPTFTETPAKSMFISEFETLTDLIAARYHESRSVGVFTPSHGRTNAVSKQIAALVLNLKKRNVPICMQTDSNFQANGVAILTFHSCAGTEFDYTFVFGVSNYPNSYPEIGYAVGRSLMFIASTRAKKQIVYVLDSPKLGVDLSERLIPGDAKATANASTILYELPQKYVPNIPKNWTVETMINSDAIRYLNNNDIRLEKYAMKKKHFASTTKVDLLLAFGGIPCNAKYLSAKNSDGTKITPTAGVRNGRITRGMMIDDFAFDIDVQDQTKKSKELYAALTNTRLETRITNTRLENGNAKFAYDAIYSFISEDRNENGNADEDLKSRIKWCNFMSRAGYVVAPEMCIGEDAFICIVENDYEALFVGAVMWLYSRKRAVIYAANVATNTITKYDDFHEILGYQLEFLRRTHIYYETTIHRDAYLGKSRAKMPDTYAVDTEFMTNIYDIGLVNIDDPYLSFSVPIFIEEIDRERLQKMGLNYDELRKIGTTTLDDLDLKLSSIASRNGRKPTLYYFSATKDVSWSDFCEYVDYSKLVQNYTIKRGTYESDSKTATLDALYTSVIGPQDISGRHKAYPDALDLAEIIRELGPDPK